MIRPYRGVLPRLGQRVYVDPAAQLIGDVELGDDVSLWPMAVVRGDVNRIRIGARSNVQDGSVLHTDPGLKLLIGRGCTIGHQVMLHGCTIGDNSLVGIQSVVLNRAVIGRNSMVGAGSLVPEGKQFPDGVLLMGSPAKVVRELTAPEIQMLQYVSQLYVKNAQRYRGKLRPLSQG